MSQPLRVTPALLMVQGEYPGRLFELTRPSTTIGRNPELCDIVLNSLKVSRRHARIAKSSHGFEVVDLGSRSGTKINDRLLSGAHALSDGDCIYISETLFQFQSSAVMVEEDNESATILSMMRTMEIEVIPNAPQNVHLRLKVDALAEIAKNLSRTLDLKTVLEATLATLFRVFPNANRGFVLLKGNNTELVPAAVRHHRCEAEQMKVSRTIIDLVLKDRQAILSRDVIKDVRLKITDSIRESSIRTVMIAPLPDQDGHPLGVIQIDTIHQRDAFSEEDLGILVIAAGQVAAAIENARLHEKLLEQAKVQAEADHARRVQRIFLPRKSPIVSAYEFWDYYEPAESVGGDYFAYFPVSAQTESGEPGSNILSHLGVAIGDVSGKGMPAALIMAKLSAEARVCAQTETDPARMIQKLNHQLHEDDLDGMFVTFLLAWIDLRNDQVDFVRAGHMGPLLRRDGVISDPVEHHGGPPLAVLRNRRYSAVSLHLEPGDVLVLYTDGVTDAMSPKGEPFGLDGLKSAITMAGHTARHVGEAIVRAVRQHCDRRGQIDDLTMVCIGRVRDNPDETYG